MVLCSGKIPALQDDLDEICGDPLPAPPDNQPATPLFLLNFSDYASYLGDDMEWAQKEIPFIDMHTATTAAANIGAGGEGAGGAGGVDAALLTTYYYRWRVFKKHMKWTMDGWVRCALFGRNLHSRMPLVPA
jgi:hypothetical protein